MVTCIARRDMNRVYHTLQHKSIYLRDTTLVAKAFKNKEEVIRGKGGGANTARRVALYLGQRYTGLSNKAIGDLFGGIHYSAVSKASGKLRREMVSDQRLSELVSELDSQFKT